MGWLIGIVILIFITIALWACCVRGKVADKRERAMWNEDKE